MADQTKVRPDIRILAIATAIPALDPDTDFTAGGKPEVNALEAILGIDITAAERDDAFEAARKHAESECEAKTALAAKDTEISGLKGNVSDLKEQAAAKDTEISDLKKQVATKGPAPAAVITIDNLLAPEALAEDEDEKKS